MAKHRQQINGSLFRTELGDSVVIVGTWFDREEEKKNQNKTPLTAGFFSFLFLFLFEKVKICLDI